LVGDARYLPFQSNTFHTVFSYSVLQHLSRHDVGLVVSQAGRVLEPKGISLIQMPNFLGIRCLSHQLKRRFRKATGFEVRYWSVPALRKLFSKTIGSTDISVDCYFGLGLQSSDLEFMPAQLKLVIKTSELLRKASSFIPFLTYASDSVYVKSIHDKDNK